MMIWLAASLCMVPGTVSGQSASYQSDKEIAFEMNSATEFVRIPAEYNWVKAYSLGTADAAMPAGRVSISDGKYRFSMPEPELRKLCGNGARRLPIKARITDCRSKKEKSFHITRLMVRYRTNGHADVQMNGYIFDK